MHYGWAYFWDVAKGRVLAELMGNDDDVNAVAFSPDGRLALSGAGEGPDETLKLWDVSSAIKHPTTTPPLLPGVFDSETKIVGFGAGVNSVAFSPDCAWLLSGSEDKTLKLWDAADTHKLRILVGHMGAVRSAAFFRLMAQRSSRAAMMEPFASGGRKAAKK